MKIAIARGKHAVILPERSKFATDGQLTIAPQQGENQQVWRNAAPDPVMQHVFKRGRLGKLVVDLTAVAVDNGGFAGGALGGGGDAGEERPTHTDRGAGG